MKLDYQGQGELGKLDITRLTKELNLRFLFVFFSLICEKSRYIKWGCFSSTINGVFAVYDLAVSKRPTSSSDNNTLIINESFSLYYYVVQRKLSLKRE